MVGFMLAHEQFPVAHLIELGIAAEQAGFDLLATCDHLQPWQANEGHSGVAWATIGALSQRTSRVWMGNYSDLPDLSVQPSSGRRSIRHIGVSTTWTYLLGSCVRRGFE